MNSQQLQIMAAIFAANARIAGMKAENQYRVANGWSVSYAEDAFLKEAQHLESLAIQAANS